MSSDVFEDAEEEVRLYKWIHYFIHSGEVQLHGKTLTAYDCGGEVFQAQRGKSVPDLMKKFGAWMDEVDGVCASLGLHLLVDV